MRGRLDVPVQALADFLIDERCHACGRPPHATAHLDRPRAPAASALASPLRVGFRRFGVETRPLCRACCHALVASTAPVRIGPLSVWPAFESDDRLLTIIHALKFSRRQRIAGWLAHAMAEGLPARARDAGAVLVPVPMDRASLRRRGFNQAERLASSFGARMRMRVERRALVKTRATAPQSSLGRAERIRNVADVMDVVARDAIAGRRVILVDDLVTTGATASSCAAALSRAGAECTQVVCVGYRP